MVAVCCITPLQLDHVLTAHPGPRDLYARAIGTATTAIVVVTVLSLLILDPYETVTTDLPRLYGQFGWSLILWVGSAGLWAVGVLAAVRGVLQSLVRRHMAQRPSSARRLGDALLLTAVTCLSAVVPFFTHGLAAYSQAEDGGFAPAGVAAGTVTSGVLQLGVVLGVMAALVYGAAWLTGAASRVRGNSRA